jgi:hypothetical protein
MRDYSKLHFCHDSIISQRVMLEPSILQIAIETITAGLMSQHVIRFNIYEEKFENIAVMAEGVKGFL